MAKPVIFYVDSIHISQLLKLKYRKLYNGPKHCRQGLDKFISAIKGTGLENFTIDVHLHHYNRWGTYLHTLSIPTEDEAVLWKIRDHAKDCAVNSKKPNWVDEHWHKLVSIKFIENNVVDVDITSKYDSTLSHDHLINNWY